MVNYNGNQSELRRIRKHYLTKYVNRQFFKMWFSCFVHVANANSTNIQHPFHLLLKLTFFRPMSEIYTFTLFEK